MEQLPGIEAFVATFLAIAALALFLTLAATFSFVRTNRAARRRQGVSLVPYYRALLHAVPAH